MIVGEPDQTITLTVRAASPAAKIATGIHGGHGKGPAPGGTDFNKGPSGDWWTRSGPLDVARSGRHWMRLAKVRGHSVETELVALDVLHHEARLVEVIGRQ